MEVERLAWGVAAHLHLPSGFSLILNLSVSRLAGMDQTIHKLTVGHYTLDVKVSQLIDRLTTMDCTTLPRLHNSAATTPDRVSTV